MTETPNSLEVVSLDHMDGFEFQQFVAHLFEKLGYGKTEEILTTGDAGRDVTIRSSDGSLIVIECKHHTKGTVGRPVVQKLHSAVITARAKKGFVVTTGRFSDAAIEYARSLGSIIELVDSRVLYDMANRSHIRVIRKGEKTDVYQVIPPSAEFVSQSVVEHLIGNALSHPKNPEQLAENKIMKIHFTPVYNIQYNLNEDFSTTVGVIHSIRIHKDHVLLNGENGQLLQRQLSKMITPNLVAYWNPSISEASFSSGKFALDYSSIKSMALKQIQQKNTTTVGYYGANNVYYTKNCVPQISKILIQSITQVYLPIITTKCSILSRQHQLMLCGNQKEVAILQSDAGKCEICGKELENERLLCNSCGKIVCAPSFMGHSYTCEVCSKTICKECAYWTRKYLLFKKKICKECSEEVEKKGKKIKKFETS